MSQSELMQMADILLLAEPEVLTPTWLLLSGLLAVFIITILLWRFLMQPLTQLKRHLKQGKLSPREAAHHLARLANGHSQLQPQIDRLRFQRQTPECGELFDLINRVKHGR